MYPLPPPTPEPSSLLASSSPLSFGCCVFCYFRAFRPPGSPLRVRSIARYPRERLDLSLGVLPITHELASHTYLFETRSLQQQAADQRETHPPATPPTFYMPHGALSLYSTRMRGRRVLQCSLARSCIERPSKAARMTYEAHTLRGRGLSRGAAWVSRRGLSSMFTPHL
jgi:hypothetical protein